MQNVLRSYVGRICAAAFAAILPTFVPVALAQQDEVPPVVELEDINEEAAAQPPDSGRIVEGRPDSYSFERGIHPVAWLEGGMRPLLRLIEKAGIPGAESGTERMFGVKYGIQSLGTGSGFGPEIKLFNRNLFNSGIQVDVPLVITYKNYQSVRLRGRFPIVRGKGVEGLGLDMNLGYASRAADNFFGIGNDSDLENESHFRSVTRSVGVGLNGHFTRSWSAGVEENFRSVGITRPDKFLSDPISALEIFRNVDVPGLTVNTTSTLVSTSAFVQRDTRDGPYLATSGGLERLEAILTEGLGGGDFSYWKYRAEVQRYFPLTDDHRTVIGLRARAETVQDKGGSGIPFFDLPTIGGYPTMRGFESRRFTDKSAVSGTLEYRYRIWRYFDWHLFMDIGQVAPSFRDLERKRFHQGYGMGFIVRADEHRAIIFDVAHSREASWMFHFDINSLF